MRCSAPRPLIQRCTLHKRRNVAEHLPDKDKAWVDAKLVKAFGHPDPDHGLRNAKHLAAQLEKSHPGAAASLREGLEEMFTVARLGIDGRLAKTLTTSNPVESMISIARTTNRNVTRWRDGQMVLRWTAAGMLNAERSFRRIKGYKQMPQLVEAPYTDTPIPKRPPTSNLSVPPPRVHHGSSPKFHETRDMLVGTQGCGHAAIVTARSTLWSVGGLKTATTHLPTITRFGRAETPIANVFLGSASAHPGGTCSTTVLASAVARPSTGVTTSGTPPRSRNAAPISCARSCAFAAFVANSSRTASSRACTCRVCAICTSVLVSCCSVRSWVMSFWVVVSIIVLLCVLCPGSGVLGSGMPRSRVGESSFGFGQAAVHKSRAVVEATRAPLAGAISRWTDSLEPVRDSP